MTLETAEWIGLAGVASAFIIGTASWVLSARLTKRTLESRVLGYRFAVSPLFQREGLRGDKNGLKIEFNGELLGEAALLTVEIGNMGNRAIENPPILIELPDGTYLIPMGFEDLPNGYKDLWQLRRVDAKECVVDLEHINPGQTVKALFIMNEIPGRDPIFKCAMKNVEVRPLSNVISSKQLMTLFLRSFSVGTSVHIEVRR